MTKRTRWRIQAAEKSFLSSVAGCSLREWMPPGHLPREVLQASLTGMRLQGSPRTCWRDYVSQLAWERLRILPQEVESVEREVWASLLRLLPLLPGPG
ncbi:hypothetical protein D4764_14G0003870 [Takifugu flavidus]|uniref:Uncharacterized protein n=1 Tax=Takifugu flavidus TaxID=433684 RepID=A0A5C6P3I2_9TELE|nr:hypothetical protein D4764_14G0003870 [Takifugu flavidus]